MGVVFDEVTASVIPEPSQATLPRESEDEQRSEAGEALRWQRLQDDFQRRQARLEAD